MSLSTSTQPVVSSLAGGRDIPLADAGAFFVATTPTPGTGIVTSASVQAFTATTPYFVVFNGNSAGGANIYPIYLRLTQSVIGATASVATFLTNTLDLGNLVTSGGTALTKVNTTANNANTGNAICTVGAITAPAATGARKVVSHSKVRSLTIGVVHDSIALNWGAPTQALTSTLINNTTSKSDTVFNCAPIVISPGWSMSLIHWAASQTTGSTYEVEFGYVEK